MLNNMVISGSVNGSPTLLWSNETPSSSFAAQTISLPTGYKAYLVEMKMSLNSTAESQIVGIAYVPFGTDFPCAAYLTDNYQAIPRLTYCRVINSAYSGGINFGSGFENNTGYARQDNNCAIPTRIWGLPYTI